MITEKKKNKNVMLFRFDPIEDKDILDWMDAKLAEGHFRIGYFRKLMRADIVAKKAKQ
jgi:hypothetical protein